jgi:hypothetical protein
MDEWGSEIYTGKGPSPEEKWNERYNQWMKETRPVQEQKKEESNQGSTKINMNNSGTDSDMGSEDEHIT